MKSPIEVVHLLLIAEGECLSAADYKAQKRILGVFADLRSVLVPSLYTPTIYPYTELVNQMPDCLVKDMHGRPVVLTPITRGRCDECQKKPSRYLVMELTGEDEDWCWCGECDIGG